MQQSSSEKGPASRDWERGVSPSGGRLQPGSAGNLKDSARGGDARHGGTDLPIPSGHLTILHGCAHFTLTSRVRQIGGVHSTNSDLFEEGALLGCEPGRRQ
jgi:hypothetical protein